MCENSIWDCCYILVAVGASASIINIRSTISVHYSLQFNEQKDGSLSLQCWWMRVRA